MNYKILVVDDEPANTRMLQRILREDYDVIAAQSGADALEALSVHDIALIISDQRMPGMTGIEFLKRSATIRPNCVRLILTGYTDAADLVDAVNSGVVYKYVTKPWVNIDLLQTVMRGLAHHETIKAQHMLNLENERLRERLAGTEGGYQNLCFEILSTKNESARERAPRVRALAGMVGRALELDGASLAKLETAGYLHGIADIYIPGGLRARKDCLTSGEGNFVAKERARGLALLAGLSDAEDLIDSIRYTSEHFDGSGTSGLSHNQIPLSSRIIAVAKLYDELLFPESEARGSSVESAMLELRGAAGKRFDPHVVKAFCGLVAVAEVQKLVFGTDQAVAI